MKKIQKRLSILVGVLVLLYVLLEFCLGSAAKTLINNAGPAFLKTDIHVEHVTARIFSGILHIRGLRVGAPEGFDANVFEMPELTVRLKPSSLFSDTIQIDEITIREPMLTYELKGISSNLSALLAPFEKEQADEEKEPDKDKNKDEKTDKPGKKVVISHFLFAGAHCRLAFAAGKGAVVPLPTIELTDIGAKNGGATALEATYEILKSISVGTLSAVGDLVGAVGGVTVDAASAVGSAAVDAAGAIAGGIADGIGALTGLVTGGDKDKPAEQPATEQPAE